ncbi:hypothetical protein BZP36_07270 [Raoultella terrigena]|jgi:hypothetical protein|nr:hypothetical protein BZP36_07270 [Raoultella terrigena]
MDLPRTLLNARFQFIDATDVKVSQHLEYIFSNRLQYCLRYSDTTMTFSPIAIWHLHYSLYLLLGTERTN